ncbi:MAG TPA: DEAD/DEAH box helicase [Nitrosospira sp.]|nr:DEAD/DEAH box helicase [Nitrosospira sp.]
MNKLTEWLISNPFFNEQLNSLVCSSVAVEFDPVIRRDGSLNNLSYDWPYLLLCASILTSSEKSDCQDAALRIAQFCLQSENVSAIRKDAAALILDTLANKVSLHLAEKRGWLQPSVDERLPLSALIDWTNRKIEYSLELENQQRYSLNRFQKKFWDAARSTKLLSVSAPTSAGKSFIVNLWLAEELANHTKLFVAYIVPTRALISQVENDLLQLFASLNLKNINVSSIPMKKFYSSELNNVFVFTQERLHIFLSAFEIPPKIDLLIVDEAQKVGDEARGILLEQVIEGVVETNPEIKIMFASPLMSNPEVLLDDASSTNGKSLVSEDVTVSQNLIWLNQQPLNPRNWDFYLCLKNDVRKIGALYLSSSPSVGKRLPFVASALTRHLTGTIIYVNGAFEAEKTAQLLYDGIHEEASRSNGEINDLIELCKETIHPHFLLARTLERGVAFHYGNIPLLIKAGIEKLFSNGAIKYLVSTSTLIEGVNLACKTIIVRGPRKGQKRLMSSEDFWNLAGRAGRWGKEFQGNIICVDADNPTLWLDGKPPRFRSGLKIERALDNVLRNHDDLIKFVIEGTPRSTIRKRPDLEYTYSYLAQCILRGRPLAEVPVFRRLRDPSKTKLAEVLYASVADLETPLEIVERNPGISPLAMDNLLKRFRKSGKAPEPLLLAEPGSSDAFETYTAAFVRIAQTLNPALGYTSRNSALLALTVTRWMRGYSLARIIDERLKWLRNKGITVSESRVIRNVMDEVETIARYQAPKNLSCYNDLLKFYLMSIDRNDLAEKISDLSIFLEFGVSNITQISLMSLGLSRTSTIFISEKITADNLDEEAAFAWINENLGILTELPRMARTEIEVMLKANKDS